MSFLPVLGAVMQVGGMLEQGAATSNAENYQAAVARNNAITANRNADYAINAGIAQSEKQSLKNRSQLGRIKAAQAANNVDVNTGSAADVQTSERQIGELDTETVMNNAELRAYGYRTQATSFTAQSELDKAEADQAQTASYIGAAGSLIGSAPSLGFKWSGSAGGSGAGEPLSLNPTDYALGGNEVDYAAVGG